MASRDGSIPKRQSSKSSKKRLSKSPSPPLMTLSSTSSTASSVTAAGGNKLSSSKMMKSSPNDNFVGIYYDFKRKEYTASISRDHVKIHLGSYKLKADAAFAYDRATKVMIPPAVSIRRENEFNFPTLKDYEKAKKNELTMLGWSKDAAMTSGEITTKVNDIISKRCGNYDFDSSGDSSEEFDESSDNDDDEDLVEDESDISPLEVSSSADIKVTEDDTKKNGNKGRLLKRDKKWNCPKCEGDVRLPPQNSKGDDDEKSSVHDYLNTTHVMCALKKCPDPRYHVSIE